MSRRRLSWNAALRDLKDDRLVRAEVREERLRTLVSLRNPPALALSAWRGRSGRRYIVGIYKLSSADPADFAAAAVLFVCRNADGIASIISAAHDVPVISAEALIERAAASGANEVHIHRLAEPHERADLVADVAPARPAAQQAA